MIQTIPSPFANQRQPIPAAKHDVPGAAPGRHDVRARRRRHGPASGRRRRAARGGASVSSRARVRPPSAAAERRWAVPVQRVGAPSRGKQLKFRDVQRGRTAPAAPRGGSSGAPEPVRRCCGRCSCHAGTSSFHHLMIVFRVFGKLFLYRWNSMLLISCVQGTLQ